MREEREEFEALRIIAPEQVTGVSPKEIDRTIDEIVQNSKENYAEIEGLMLECSAALSSAEGRSAALSDQGFFKRCWNDVTGKNNKLRNAILQDQTAAQYAMQQMINRALQECGNNAALMLAVKGKLEGELTRLEDLQVNADQEINRVREALVRFYRQNDGRLEAIRRELDSQKMHIGSRCELCREPLTENQVVCPKCGTLQGIKMDDLPPATQEKLRLISNLMRDQKDWNPDIYWDDLVKSSANKLSKARAIAESVGMLDEFQSFAQDMDELLDSSRKPEFQIAIVGVVKAGKSMLMNALIGLELAPVGINSKTAALTKFRSSASGHYVRVRFHTDSEWESLIKSVKSSNSTQSPDKDSGEDQDEGFAEKLNRKDVQDEAKKWVGHEDIRKSFVKDDVAGLKTEIEAWVASQSNRHLFVSEVEVGIDKDFFDMRPEVVFVDTPGLYDPVKYRSEITEKYINRADAVLVAVKLDALSDEARRTITRTIENTGGDTKKVFIVGSRKDKLNDFSDCDTIISGQDGWIKQLVSRGKYPDERAANRQIFATSAYLHLCMKRAIQLTYDELQDEKVFSNNDYNNLENGIKKTVNKRSYKIEELRTDRQTIESAEKEFGIEALRSAINDRLISKSHKFMVEKFVENYRRCRSSLLAISSKHVQSKNKELKKAQSGSAAIAEELDEIEQMKKQVEAEKTELDNAIKKLREFTAMQFASLNT